MKPSRKMEAKNKNENLRLNQILTQNILQLLFFVTLHTI
jgi:hypothetical protein